MSLGVGLWLAPHRAVATGGGSSLLRASSVLLLRKVTHLSPTPTALLVAPPPQAELEGDTLDLGKGSHDDVANKLLPWRRLQEMRV